MQQISVKKYGQFKEEKAMQIKINGESAELQKDHLNIADLLVIKEVESPDMVSVQLNGEIIDRSQYQAQAIKENDELDFLYFMGGGAVQ